MNEGEVMTFYRKYFTMRGKEITGRRQSGNILKEVTQSNPENHHKIGGCQFFVKYVEHKLSYILSDI